MKEIIIKGNKLVPGHTHLLSMAQGLISSLDTMPEESSKDMSQRSFDRMRRRRSMVVTAAVNNYGRLIAQSKATNDSFRNGIKPA